MKRLVQMELEFKEIEKKVQKAKRIEKDLNSIKRGFNALSPVDIRSLESKALEIESNLKNLDRIDETENEFLLFKKEVDEKREEEKQIRKERRRKEIRRELALKIEKLINDESFSSEEYLLYPINVLKKIKDAVEHDNISDAEKYHKLLDEKLSQSFNFRK